MSNTRKKLSRWNNYCQYSQEIAFRPKKCDYTEYR